MQKKKQLERWSGRQWVNLIMLLTRFLTLKKARVFGRALGNLGFYLIPRHRRMALQNMAMIYGSEKSKQELQEMARRTFIHASCFGWELLYLYTHTSGGKDAQDLVKRIDGLEHLKKAVAQGKGVIGLSAHLGNFPVLGKKLSSLGFSSTTIMRQMRDEKLETMFSIMRTNYGQNWIPKFPVSKAIKESLSWLRQGKILMLYLDQRSSSGVKVDFMGIPTPTPTGAAVFALKTESPVLPIVNIRNGNGSYKLIIGEEIPLVKTGDHKQDILANTAKFNQAIEKYIRLYPEQWFWFHNRWKGVKK